MNGTRVTIRLILAAVVACAAAPFTPAADAPLPTLRRALDPAVTLQRPATLPRPAPAAAPDGLRILVVDDDWSHNNSQPADRRRSPSDTLFAQLAADAVGGDAQAWKVETVPTYRSGPSIDVLRGYSVILWYTGASYGGNPDNTAVLSLEDEKTLRQYLQETGGTVLVFSPGYVGKVSGGSWDRSSWPFLREVLGLRGARGLAQRFAGGAVRSSQGGEFRVGNGTPTLESQFSAVNPETAQVLFTAELAAPGATGSPSPVATLASYGTGRIVYVGFTFENLAETERAPAFQQILAAAGVAARGTVARLAPPSPPVTRNPAPTTSTAALEPATVQVTGTPTTATVSWTLQGTTAPGTRPGSIARLPATTQNSLQPAPTVQVLRLVPGGAPVPVALSPTDPSQAVDPGPLTPGRAVTYRVSRTDASGAVGFRDASFTPPPATDPSGLAATTAANGTVTLSWQPVADAVGYRITGSTLGAPVRVSHATSWTSPPQTPGIQRWKVAALYAPGDVLTAESAWPSVTSRRVPNPGAPYLLLPNGAGSIADATAAYDRQCEVMVPANGWTDTGSEDCPHVQFTLWQFPEWRNVWHCAHYGIFNENVPFPACNLHPTWPTAAFADLQDLGVGRRVSCTASGSGADRRTVCWATNHGVPPAAGQAPDGAALARAAEQGGGIASMSVIVLTAQGAYFGVHAPLYRPRTIPNESPEDAFIDVSNKRYIIDLDSQGMKTVPHACLSCHGGRYDPATRMVTGASLLPLVPASLTFSSPAARAAAEEPIRRINQMIVESNPAPAIRAQIQAMYGGAPGTPGRTANDAAVPAGWSSQPGLYRQVIAPYCGSCHFAQTGSLNFATYANLVANRDRVQRTVCETFTMPHSEQGLRRFWTEGGSVLLPGLLSTTLGFARCPQ